MGQEFNYAMVQQTLAKIEEDNGNVKKALDEANEFIKENVGSAGKAWSGESAIAFRGSWDTLANNVIPERIKEVQQQAKNLEAAATRSHEGEQAL